MKHNISVVNDIRHIEYYWKICKNWNYLKLQASLYSSTIADNSLESFMSDHYLGYTKTGNNKTLEFEIQHSPWNIYHAQSFEMNFDAKKIYGEEFSEYFRQKPLSVFLMDGSRTKVSFPVLL